MHGLTPRGHNNRIVNILYEMRSRCSNKNRPNYKYYGARGIEVCKEWKEDTKSFHDWAIKNGYQEDLTIDRKDNDRNYEPGNCRWIPMADQNLNKRLLSPGKSKHRGVIKSRYGKRWTATVYNGKNTYIGTYDSEDEAMIARSKYIDDNNLKNKKETI